MKEKCKKCKKRLREAQWCRKALETCCYHEKCFEGKISSGYFWSWYAAEVAA